MTTSTNYTYVTDWNEIAHMTHAGSENDLTFEPLYIPVSDAILTVTYDGKTVNLSTGKEPVWSHKAIKAAKMSQEFIDLIVERTKKWCDKRDKAITERKPLPKWKRATIVFEYKGRARPAKVRQPLLPLTAEQNMARIARNRAKFGLV